MERDLQDVKEEIRARTDLVEIIGNYTRLKRSGKNWTGLCPFHSDKNPSFSVSPTLGIYKCYSCGEGGDLFKFVQKKENLEFIEAIEFLARRAGIEFERKGVNPEKASEREQMLEMNALAVRFFQDRLTKSPDAQAYLAHRGILKSTQDEFQLGFAPDDYEALTFFLQKQRADMALAVKIGLLKERKEGRSGTYDTFRNRLMFPIFDVTGRVIAFGGRAMGDDKAKYLNSEGSAIFDKSRTLYGLNFARKKLSGDIPAVFVEGYVDVITAHQAGFSQCVATLGTSMTEEHARLLVRYNPRVVICYDSDSAGIKATLRGAAVWEAIGIEGAEVRVARLPAGDDPDSLLKRGEIAVFQNALDNAIPRVEFQLELALKNHDTATAAGRDNALAEIIPILASLPQLTLRSRYVQQYSYLHPLHAHNVARAEDQILADAAAYAKQSHARDRNYPLTEEANRAPLENAAPAPSYRPPSANQWGQTNEWPNTKQVRPGNGGYGDNKPGNWRDRKNRQSRPASDTTPPSLAAPTVSGAEKAERQLLRGLFSAEFRSMILSRLQPDLLVTAQGRTLFERVSRTPAGSDGTIDPRPLLRQAEEEEEKAGGGQELADAMAEYDPSSGGAKKLSYYIREVLEDFGSLVSNEPLNEAAMIDCIRRLQKRREEQSRQELLRRMEHLSPEEKRAALQEYTKKMLESKGSRPAEDGGPQVGS